MGFDKKIIVLILLLIFTANFLQVLNTDLIQIFKKDLYFHDESSNSVVSANLTRKFFPPMVRTTPMFEEQGNWMEGPYWQHIPPLFTYVPWVFFKFDGQVSIEVKRLSYAFLLWLTGIIFIAGTYRFSKKISVALAAAIAGIFFTRTLFTRALIWGTAFGTSDIFLAFTVVLSFLAILWYLEKEKIERLNCSWKKIALVALICSLSILAKSTLGAIPLFTFLAIFWWDYGFKNKRFWIGILSAVGLIVLHYGILFLSSPQTFQKEFLTSFLHLTDYEGWGRPWHYYLTYYYNVYYLGPFKRLFFLLFGLGLVSLIFYKYERKSKILLALSSLWFIWNMVAVSLVSSKIPNFVFQSYLLGLFFVIYLVVFHIKGLLEKYIGQLLNLTKTARSAVAVILIVSTGAMTADLIIFTKNFKLQRALAYPYLSEHEKSYQVAEELQKKGLGTKDLVLIQASHNDCWFRYYVLFLTGAEARTLLELSSKVKLGTAQRIILKYQRLYLVTKVDKGEYIEEHDLKSMNENELSDLLSNLVRQYRDQIDMFKKQIKLDPAGCEWLIDS